MTRGVPTRAARGLFGGICVCLGGLAMLSMQFMPNDALKIGMIVIGFALPAVIYVMGHAMVSEDTPPQQRGAMIAINNAVATSAGIIGPFCDGQRYPGDRDGCGRLRPGLRDLRRGACWVVCWACCSCVPRRKLHRFTNTLQPALPG